MSNENWPVYSFSQALGRLPFPAQSKYRALAAQADDSAALLRATIERGKVLKEQAYHVEMRLGRLDPKTEADDIKKLQQQRDALRIEIGTLEQRRAKFSGVKGNSEQVLAQLQSFIPALCERGGGGRLRAVSISAKPRDNETLKDAILRLRNAITTAQGEINRLRMSPLPPADIKSAIVAHIEKMAAQGQPRLDVENGKVQISFPDEIMFSAPGAVRSAPCGSATQLVAWLFKDRLIDALTNGVDQIKGGVSQVERDRRSAELNAQLRRLEHEEEALVLQALEAGLECHRRVMASPFALLGLDVEDVDQPVLEAG